MDSDLQENVMSLDDMSPEQLRDEIINRTEDIEAYKGECKRLGAAAERMCQMVLERHGRIQHVEAYCKKMQVTISKLHDKLDTISSEREDLSLMAQKWKEKHQSLSKTFTDKLVSYKTLRQEFEEAQHKLVKMTAEAKDKEELHIFCLDEKSVESSVAQEHIQLQYNILKKRYQQLEETISSSPPSLPNIMEEHVCKVTPEQHEMIVQERDELLITNEELCKRITSLEKEKEEWTNIQIKARNEEDASKKKRINARSIPRESVGKLESLIISNELLREEGISLQGKISKLKEAKTELQCTIAELNVTIEHLNRAIASRDLRIADGETIRKQQKKEHDEALNRGEDAHTQDLKCLQDKCDTLQQQIIDHQKSYEQMKDEVNIASKEVEKAQNECIQAQEREKRVKEESHSYHDTLKRLQNDLRLQHKKHSKEILELRNQFKEEDYKSRYAKVVEENKSLEQKVDKMKSLLTIVKALAKNQRAAAEAVKENTQLVKRHTILVTEKHSVAEECVAEWRMQVATAEEKSRKVQAINTKLVNVERNLHQTRSNLHDTSSQLKVATNQLEDMNALVYFLENENSVRSKIESTLHQEQYNTLSISLEEAHSKSKVLEEIKEKLENEIQTVQSTCAILREEVTSKEALYQEEKKDANEKRQVLNTKVVGLQTALVATQKAEQELTQVHHITCAALKGTKLQIEHGTAREQALTTRMEEVEERVSLLSTNLNHAVTKHKEAQEREEHLNSTLQVKNKRLEDLVQELKEEKELKEREMERVNALGLDVADLTLRISELTINLEQAEKLKEVMVAQVEASNIAKEEALLHLDLLVDVARMLPAHVTATTWDTQRPAHTLNTLKTTILEKENENTLKDGNIKEGNNDDGSVPLKVGEIPRNRTTLPDGSPASFILQTQLGALQLLKKKCENVLL